MVTERPTEFLSTARAAPRPFAAAAGCSHAALVLTLLLFGAACLLISPPLGGTSPGAIPWRDTSLLRPLTELLSLGGLLQSIRGVEIKDLALHLATAAGLVLVAIRVWLDRHQVETRRRDPTELAQLLLGGWVLLSLAGCFWSADPQLAWGQGLLYTLHLAWAVALARTLERRDLPALLGGVVVISAATATLCIWYYYERNPHHRPGFPLGNPNVLAAVLVPAVLICAARLADALQHVWRTRAVVLEWPTIGAAVALVPLLYALYLTYARGPLLALLVGLAALVVFQLGRRLRWALSAGGVVALLLVATWWYSTSHLDVAMARGASMRFRLYAWRYAAQLWELHPIAGHGPAVYPRVAGSFAVGDRALDPAAFMGEIVEHAHNELFEVLTEIGLVGGVTFVAGFVATLFAGSAALRLRAQDPQRWVLLGLTTALIALLTDAMVGVTLRLPGGPAVFFTLLGTLWAAARRAPAPPAATDLGWKQTGGVVLIITGCLVAAGASAWLALQNWSGVTRELAAHQAYNDDRHATALEQFEAAEPRLLDPVRVIITRKLALECHFARAADAYSAWIAQESNELTSEAARTAIDRVQDAHRQAVRLGLTAPSAARSDAIAARTAEWLADMAHSVDVGAAQRWHHTAWQAWHRQLQRAPFDVETLLVLASPRYPALLETRVGWLRDALRFGNPRGAWRALLHSLSRSPEFSNVVSGQVAQCEPITPDTAIDAIIASRAPETRRLAAAWYDLQNDPRAAARQAELAAALYQPIRPRFPEHQSIAMAEQADYLLRISPEDAATAADILRSAIASLPTIQAQMQEEMTRPFRLRLVRAQLAAEQVSTALETLQETLGPDARDPETLEQWLQRLIYDAALLGVSPARLGVINRELCPQFSSFCEPGDEAPLPTTDPTDP